MPRRKANDLSIPGHIWQQPSGTWSGRYTAEDGFRPQRTFATKEEVIQWLYDTDRLRRLGRYIPPHEMTVTDLVERWLTEGETYQINRPVTRYRRRRKWEQHIQPVFGHLRVQEVDRARLHQWVLGLAAKYSASLIASLIAILNGAFREAVELGIVAVNPVAGLKRPAAKKKPVRTWTLADCAKLWPVIEADAMWYAVYRLMLATGMRGGELRALVWGDVSFERKRVHVHRTMTLSERGKVTVGDTTKTGEGRTIDLGAETLEALARWREVQTIRPIDPSRNFVFGLRPSIPLGLSYWQHKHRQFATAAGIPVIRLHDLRHTMATISLERGIPIKIVSDILGHARIQTTIDRYLHPSDDLQRSAADMLDELLTAKSTAV